jgi:Transcription factor WhiB
MRIDHPVRSAAALGVQAVLIIPVPDLNGAACAGRSDLFDLRPVDSDDHSYREALALCARCAVLGACRAWFASLPAEARPYGVTAGRIHRPRGPRARESSWKRSTKNGRPKAYQPEEVDRGIRALDVELAGRHGG